jgi:hypothetical protein
VAEWRQLILATSYAPTHMAPRLACDEVERHIPPSLEPLRHDAALLTTELVANAVMHGRSVADVDLCVDDDALYLSVVDFGPGVPAIREPDQQGGGYGLHLVDKLATRWGHEMLAPQGKRVWFELRPGPRALQPSANAAGIASGVLLPSMLGDGLPQHADRGPRSWVTVPESFSSARDCRLGMSGRASR